jgi:hypothetical protein
MVIHCFFVIWLVSKNIVWEVTCFEKQKVAALVTLIKIMINWMHWYERVNKKNELLPIKLATTYSTIFEILVRQYNILLAFLVVILGVLM